MAYLNQQEREALARELAGMKYNQAKGKLRRMDPDGKLAFLRNAQLTGEYLTRYELFGKGVVVTLVEREVGDPVTRSDAPGSAMIRTKPEMALDEVIIDPMPENRT